VRKSVWLWVLLAILAILVLGLIFGGYRKGEKLGEPAGSGVSVVVQGVPAGHPVS
jgi:hypothetical protein